MEDDSKRTLAVTNILHLTDFSNCSETALRWAAAIARANQAELSVLHVLVPDMLARLTPDSFSAALELQEKRAQWEMRRIGTQVEDSPHQTIIARGEDVWSVVEAKQKELGSDLIVLGTHGRTGLNKLFLGSVAERVLRRSTVPVMTVGPEVAPALECDGKFHRVLLATNLAPGAAAAADYATAVAQRDQAELVLLHACKAAKKAKSEKFSELSVAEVFHRLDELVGPADKLRRPPETLVEFGDAGTQILEVARRKKADLIVMGVRKAGSLLAATHLEMGTTHNVVAHAPCPVVTVRPSLRDAA
ncbi:MAG: universal stress protein [Acidobacteria bacterium]|nr:universal stress protein [Acidobacteriota bacterium]MBS1866653.1 universal stress protein [Acidobacteriota bacterium]